MGAERGWRVRETLTKREVAILALAADGNTDKALAHNLGIARSTVSNHISLFLLKLDAANRAHAVAIAMHAGFISAHEPQGTHHAS
jgi:DNA-binding NarL/FixJ family response regulator